MACLGGGCGFAGGMGSSFGDSTGEGNRGTGLGGDFMMAG